jgi:hypothetical protein
MFARVLSSVFFLCASQLFSESAHAQGAFMLKDDAFDVIEECRPNYSRAEIIDDPTLNLSVECQNKCVESKLNDWLSESPNNKESYFGEDSVHIVERTAGLLSCPNRYREPKRSSCLAQWSPDIIAKLGEPGCDFRMECEVNFDIDDDGYAINSNAKCEDGPAQAEFEREALCLLRNTQYSGYRGLKNVAQPFEFTAPESCPNS